MRRLSEMLQEREALEKEFLEKLRAFETKWEGASVSHISFDRTYALGFVPSQLAKVTICVTV